MPVGKLSQEIHLRALPPGFTFTVTGFEPVEEGDWYACLESPRIPFQVSPGEGAAGLVGTTVLGSTDVVGGGKGPAGLLRFEVSGTVAGRAVTQTGYLRLSSTEWGTLSRPDYSVMTYALDGASSPEEVTQSVSRLTTPDPVSLVVALDAGNNLMIGATAESDVLHDVLSAMVGGILGAHVAMVKWVVKAI